MSSPSHRTDVAAGPTPDDQDDSKRPTTTDGTNHASSDPSASAEQGLLSELSGEFFTKDFDPIKALLESLPSDQFDVSVLDQQLEITRQRNQAVSDALSSKVIGSYGDFVSGMGLMQELSLDMQLTSFLCRKARSKLDSTKMELTRGGLKVFQYRRRQLVVETLMEVLTSIQTVESQITQVEELVEKDEFPLAVDLCLRCKEATEHLSQYAAVEHLAETAHSTQRMIAGRLNNALRETCSAFDPAQFERELIAFSMLGKGSKVLDKLHKHFLSSVETSAHNVLNAHVFSSEENVAIADKLKKLKYRGLCNYLKPEQSVSCLMTTLECLTDTMYVCHSMVRWLRKYRTDDEKRAEYLDDIRRGLKRFRRTLWSEMQRRIAPLLSASSFQDFKLEQFLSVFHDVNKFIDIGMGFSRSKVPAKQLTDSIRKQSRKYFIALYSQRLEDLPTILEAENWQKMPVPMGFGLEDIQPIRHFRRSMERMRRAEAEAAEMRKAEAQAKEKSHMNQQEEQGKESHSQATKTTPGPSQMMHLPVFRAFETKGNPFSKANRVRRGLYEDSDDDDDDDGNEENVSEGKDKGEEREDDVEEKEKDDDDVEEDDDVVDEKDDDVDEVGACDTGGLSVGDGVDTSSVEATPVGVAGEAMGSPPSQPLLSSTSIRFLQYIGKYLMMMKILEPVRFEIFAGVTQLFEYYMYSVFQFFGRTSSKAREDLDSAPYLLKELLTEMQRLEASVYDEGEEKKSKFAIARAHLAPGVAVTLAGGSVALAERVVAVESLVFLAQAMRAVRSDVKTLMPVDKLRYFDRFYDSSVEMVDPLRTHIYYDVCGLLIELEPIVPTISACKWDGKDVGVEHHPYVAAFLHEFEKFARRMDGVSKAGCLPPSARALLWDIAITQACDALVEGFSRVKRCTFEGRGLMKLDFMTFTTGLAKLTDRPVPAAKVDGYISAFYEPPPARLSWIKEHHHIYTSKQLLGLIGVWPEIKRKARNELTQAVHTLQKTSHKRILPEFGSFK